MLVSIPSHIKYSTIHGISQGEEQLNDFRQACEFEVQVWVEKFWCRGQYVDTVGRNKKVIAEYIRNQLEEDYAAGQISIKEITDPFTCDKKKQAKKDNRT